MKDETIRQKWKDFTNKYKQYFLSNDELWDDNLNLIKNYIIKYNKKPSETDKDKEIKFLHRKINRTIFQGFLILAGWTIYTGTRNMPSKSINISL
jgi:hypothetical protein